jgi:predicted flavoprotein YhiN
MYPFTYTHKQNKTKQTKKKQTLRQAGIKGGKDAALAQRGPLLVTHSGFSGPAVLRLSAFGARVLHVLE